MTTTPEPPTGDRSLASRDRRPSGRAHPAALAGAGLFLAGLLAWLWSGDWRWALTGVALFLLGALVAGATNTTPRS